LCRCQYIVGAAAVEHPVAQHGEQEVFKYRRLLRRGLLDNTHADGKTSSALEWKQATIAVQHGAIESDDTCLPPPEDPQFAERVERLSRRPKRRTPPGSGAAPGIGRSPPGP